MRPKTITTKRTLTLTEEVPVSDPLDCPLLGAAVLCDGEAGIVYAQYTVPENEHTSAGSRLHILRWHDGRPSGFSSMEDSPNLVPIEWGSPAARQIVSTIIVRAVTVAKLLKEGFVHTRIKCEHPLIGLPCAHRGNVVVPFGTYTRELGPAERHSEPPEPALLMLVYKQEDFPPEERWAEPKMVVEVETQILDESFCATPIMRDTRAFRRAGHLVISTLESTLHEICFPTKAVPAGRAEETLVAAG